MTVNSVNPASRSRACDQTQSSGTRMEHARTAKHTTQAALAQIAQFARMVILDRQVCAPNVQYRHTNTVYVLYIRCAWPVPFCLTLLAAALSPPLPPLPAAHPPAEQRTRLNTKLFRSVNAACLQLDCFIQGNAMADVAAYQYQAMVPSAV